MLELEDGIRVDDDESIARDGQTARRRESRSCAEDDAKHAGFFNRIATSAVRGGVGAANTVRSLVERFPASTGRKLEERIHDPLIRIDEDLAVIWAPYEFMVDGKVDHCGVDLVEAVRRDGRWLISGLADTSRKACGAPAAKSPASSGR